jgi:hypothetical protein
MKRTNKILSLAVAAGLMFGANTALRAAESAGSGLQCWYYVGEEPSDSCNRCEWACLNGDNPDGPWLCCTKPNEE